MSVYKTISRGKFFQKNSIGYNFSFENRTGLRSILKTVLCYIAIYYVYVHVKKNERWLFLLGFIAAWTNQKTFILPVALVLVDLCRYKMRIERGTVSCIAGWVVGIGTVFLFATYLNWGGFVKIFVISHSAMGFLADKGHFLGFLAAWTRGILYMNPLIFFAGIIAVIYCLVKDRNSVFIIVPIWFFFGTAIFVTAIWPITRNCDLVYPALFISLGVVLNSIKKATRKIIIVVLAAVFILNYAVRYRTFEAPTAFYGYNEEGNTPVTVIKRYIGSVSRILSANPGLSHKELVDYWVQPMEKRLPTVKYRYYNILRLYERTGDEQKVYEVLKKIKAL